MLNFMKRGIAAACALALVLCAAPAARAADAPQELGTFTVCTTTDMHGRCWDMNLLNDTNTTNTMLHVSTAVKDVRSKYDNVILIDNGDVYQGTPISSYQIQMQTLGKTDLKNPMAMCLKEIGYDYSVLGNHEFNYAWDTMEEVRAYLADDSDGQNAVPTICANLYYKLDDGEHKSGDNVFEPYALRDIEIGGETKTVAIIGFENTDTPRWDIPDNYPNIVFTHPDNVHGSIAWEAERYVKEVREKGADFVIVSYHSGLGEDIAPEEIVFGEQSESQVRSMISNTTGIDFVIAGHDHTDKYSGEFFPNKEGKEIMVVNGGCDDLTRTTFAFLSDGSVVLKDSENLPLRDYAIDEDLKAKVEPCVALAEEYVNQDCGVIAEGDWSESHDFYLEQTDTMDVVNRAQIARGTYYLGKKYDTEDKVKELYSATGLDHLTVDCSSSSVVVNGDYTVQPGPMTMKDIYRLYRYDNTLYLLPLTGQEIRDILEFVAVERLGVNTEGEEPRVECIDDYFTNPVFYGLDFTYDLSREPQDRVVGLQFADGRPLEMDKVYLLAVNNYHLGNGPFAGYSTKDAVWSQLDDLGGGTVQDLIAEFIREETDKNGGKGLEPAPSNWKIVFDGTASQTAATQQTETTAPVTEAPTAVPTEAAQASESTGSSSAVFLIILIPVIAIVGVVLWQRKKKK